MLSPQLNRATTSPTSFLFLIYLYSYFIYLSRFCRNCCQVFVTQDIKEIYLFNAVNCFIHISKRSQCQNLMLPKLTNFDTLKFALGSEV